MMKTASDQAFPGPTGPRRLKMGMIVLVCFDYVMGDEDKNTPQDTNGTRSAYTAPAICTGFIRDQPKFFVPEWQKRLDSLEYVDKEADLKIGKWTFPERV